MADLEQVKSMSRQIHDIYRCAGVSVTPRLGNVPALLKLHWRRATFLPSCRENLCILGLYWWQLCWSQNHLFVLPISFRVSNVETKCLHVIIYPMSVLLSLCWNEQELKAQCHPLVFADYIQKCPQDSFNWMLSGALSVILKINFVTIYDMVRLSVFQIPKLLAKFVQPSISHYVLVYVFTGNKQPSLWHFV